MTSAMQGSWLLAIVLASCSGVRSEEPHPARAHDEPVVQPVAPPEVAANAEPDPNPSSSCGRALACCRAYASAIPDVVESSACAGVREAVSASDPDARCDAMKDGWRQALAHLSGEPPDACR